MSGGFTKGPWRVVLNRMVYSVDDFIAEVGRSIDLKADRADAHLIAAAPDMYGALEVDLDYIMTEAEKRDFDPPVPCELLADIEHALAKARGEA